MGPLYTAKLRFKGRRHDLFLLLGDYDLEYDQTNWLLSHLIPKKYERSKSIFELIRIKQPNYFFGYMEFSYFSGIKTEISNYPKVVFGFVKKVVIWMIKWTVSWVNTNSITLCMQRFCWEVLNKNSANLVTLVTWLLLVELSLYACNKENLQYSQNEKNGVATVCN